MWFRGFSTRPSTSSPRCGRAPPPQQLPSVRCMRSRIVSLGVGAVFGFFWFYGIGLGFIGFTASVGVDVVLRVATKH